MTDAKGRPVCGDCIEAARQLVAKRESRKRQTEALRRSEAAYAQAEHDNSAVLQMSEAEVLALARYACANCGRVIPVVGSGCEACGFGTALMQGTARRRRWWRVASGGRASADQASALFPLLDGRVVAWAGRGAVALGMGTPVIAMAVSWMWEGAVVLALGLTLSSAALVALARRHAPGRAAPHLVGALLACVVLLRGMHEPGSQSVMVWVSGGVISVGMQLWSMLAQRDETLVRRCIVAALMAQTGLVGMGVARALEGGGGL